ncbi:hypothetical protein BKA70DRAFT_1572618 [Coprinopsis sp. MPI-PUGE-AT-0042]|nr:hypothetical protein BKA70DRAFT_1572618 [Coprinopsis sp. MPI-PUGE-AT-0042]
MSVYFVAWVAPGNTTLTWAFTGSPSATISSKHSPRAPPSSDAAATLSVSVPASLSTTSASTSRSASLVSSSALALPTSTRVPSVSKGRSLKEEAAARRPGSSVSYAIRATSKASFPYSRHLDDDDEEGDYTHNTSNTDVGEARPDSPLSLFASDNDGDYQQEVSSQLTDIDDLDMDVWFDEMVEPEPAVKGKGKKTDSGKRKKSVSSVPRKPAINQRQLRSAASRG